MLVDGALLPALAAAAAALLVGGALLVRRLGRGRRRRLEAPLGAPPMPVARRADGRLATVLALVEAVRSGSKAPAELVPVLAATMDGLAEDARAAREATVPPGGEGECDALVAAIVRSSRLVERVLDACLALEGSTRAESHERAERSLRWARANLAAARDALAGGGSVPATPDGGPEVADEGGARPVSSVG